MDPEMDYEALNRTNWDERAPVVRTHRPKTTARQGQ